MGIYLNPGNEAFRIIRNGTYVDKSGLIGFLNKTIDTPDRLTCFSRARRFGKSFAVSMLCAYYDRSCDSGSLFEDLEIAGDESFEKYLNKYYVICIDVTRCISEAQFTERDMLAVMQSGVIRELRESFPGCVDDGETYLPNALYDVSRSTGDKFIVIIDEWDAIFREAKDNDARQRAYIQLLRGLFKGGTSTNESIAAAYMTGILPIKKYGTHSALTDFREFTMLSPHDLSKYIGFTEQEVKMLCDEYRVDFEEMKQWYDGYSYEDNSSVYNPNSVMEAIRFGRFESYWSRTETYESLKHYISMNFDGLKDAIISMFGGEKVYVRADKFQNDFISFNSRDDVLTLLIHLGYLAYDSVQKKASIPNREVAESFGDAVEDGNWNEVSKAVRDSYDLLEATIAGNSDAVAAALEDLHSSTSSVLQYNDENSLSCAITIAYYAARDYYEIVRELPAGKGFADIAFIPHRDTDKPAMIVELKCNKDADSAIRQIRQNRYDGVLQSYQGDILLVGINYEKSGRNKKRHECAIEKSAGCLTPPSAAV